jgi:hypothetical protein
VFERAAGGAQEDEKSFLTGLQVSLALNYHSLWFKTIIKSCVEKYLNILIADTRTDF